MSNKCTENTNHQYDRTLLRGYSGAAAYMGKSVSTMKRWRTQHGFPFGKLPDGTWITSTELVDRWIYARRMSRHDDMEL